MDSIICNFEFDEKEQCFVCTQCGYKNRTKFKEARRVCDVSPAVEPKPELKPPSLLQRIINFTAAATQHAIAGNPVVTEEVLQERLKICQGCELFKRNQNEVGGVCTHENCGCNIKDNLTYLNKIAWADQQCPIGKWGKSENGV